MGSLLTYCAVVVEGVKKMKLTGLHIENYRGIRSLTIDHFFNLNVFIGKNNSGKSSILASINYFFKMLRPGLVTFVAKREDFHHYETSVPIKIAGSFELDSPSHEELINAMQADLPQMQAAIENLRDLRYMSVYTATTYDDGNSISYIEKITLARHCPFFRQVSEATILSVDKSVVKELVDRAQEIQRLERVVSDMQKILSKKVIEADEFSRLKDGRLGGRARYYIREFASLENLTEIIDNSADYLTFMANVQTALENSSSRLDQLRNAELKNKIEAYSGQVWNVPQHVTAILRRLSDIKLLHEPERKKAIGRDDAQNLLNLKMKRGGMENLNQLQNIVRDLLDVHVDAFDSDEGGVAEMDVDDVLVDLNGAGIREALRLLLDITFTNPDVVLIEEPEVHLHFGLEQKLFRYLMNVAATKQLFITTHSTGFIDSSGSTGIFLVKKGSDRGIGIEMLNDTEMTNALLDLGISLSSILLAKVLVFVEGPSDEFILRAYLESRHPDIPMSAISVVKMRGFGNYRYFADAAILELLAKRNLKTFFIIDRDSRDEEDITKIRERHPEYSHLEILPAYCIENLFLNSQILTQFIQKKLRNAGKSGEEISEKDVEEKITQVTEGLFPEALRLSMVSRYLKPIYPRTETYRIADSMDEAINAVREGLERAQESIPTTIAEFDETREDFIRFFQEDWDDRKMELVPGDKVIDGVCKQYGLRYNKTQTDSYLLIQSVAEDQWPDPFRHVVKNLRNLIIAE